MTDWTSGYVSDIGYTFGYYTELNPLRSKLALLKSGIKYPEFTTACELGFGQGISTNIHAAASECSWFGTDFNPAQAGFAQELAKVSGSGASLYDEAFEDFCNRPDLPDFDYIGLHGIWSWISEKNREVIVDFARRRLKVGGVLYVSYNTMPGWAAFAPMRKLMTQHAEIIGSEGKGIVDRIDGSLAFSEELLKTNPIFLQANPQIADRIAKLKDENRHYLAHEYFNLDWHPMHFSEMLSSLESAKVGYACSADYLDQLDSINFTQDQLILLNSIPDMMLRQSIRDFMMNTQFRKDYWIKGVRRQPYFDQLEAIKDESVILCNLREEVPLKIVCGLGEANLAENIYSPILDFLSDNKEHSIGDILEAVQNKDIQLVQVVEALILLGHSSKINSVQKQQTPKMLESCGRLNNYLMGLSRSKGDQDHLASPVTGGGIQVSRLEQLYLLGLQSGIETTADLASYTWNLLNTQGQKVLKEGKALETPEQNIAEIESQISVFKGKRLEILRNLKIAQ
jgi:SAM-dependent methyltransferase